MIDKRPATIGQRTRFRADDFTLLLAALSALGVVLVLARQIVYGAGLAGDSLEYLAIAGNVLAGEGLTYLTGAPATLWPPLYPLLLAGATLGIVAPLDVAGPLNAVIFGLTIFAVGHYLRKRLAARFPVVWVCIAIALSIPLADLASWAMAGPAFMLLATAALIRADTFLVEGRTSSLVWAGVFSALAWQTRYLGIAVPVVVGLTLCFQSGASLRQRVRRCAGFSLLAGAPMALWLVRNYLIAGVMTGHDWPIEYRLPAILGDIGEGLWSWLAFDLPLFYRLSSEAPALSTAAGFGLLLAAAAVAASVIARQKHLPCCLFGGFALTYLLLLVAALAQGRTQYGFEARYLTPLYIPLLVVAAAGLDRILSGARKRTSVPSAILMLCLSLGGVGQTAANVYHIRRANADHFHIGFNRQPWSDSETLRYLRANPLVGEVHSNMPHMVFLQYSYPPSGDRRDLDLGRVEYRELPRSRTGGYVIDRPPESGRGREQLAGWLAGIVDGTWVVWFEDQATNDLFDYGAALLRTSSALEPVAELADGAVFKVNRNYAVRSDPYRSTYESIAGGSHGAPAARSVFDVYFAGNTLTYLKEPCAAGDVRPRFFLHVVPEDSADLLAGGNTAERPTFDNLDFSFPDRGVILNGKCLAVVTLPNYRISHVRTGQYVAGEGHVWDETFSPPD